MEEDSQQDSDKKEEANKDDVVDKFLAK